jgi:hypothetical protein
LKRVKDRHSVTKKQIEFRNTSGRRLKITPQAVDHFLKEHQDEWQSGMIELPAGMNLTAEIEKETIQRRRERTAKTFGISPNAPGLERLDLFSEFATRKQREFSKDSFTPPKNPSSNNWFDADLLLYNVLPAIVCTEDLRFIRAVRQLSSEDRLRVMNLSELYGFLESGVLPSVRKELQPKD